MAAEKIIVHVFHSGVSHPDYIYKDKVDYYYDDVGFHGVSVSKIFEKLMRFAVISPSALYQ
jgi:hypothetical protein